jgi:hypothetical protein
MLRQIHHWYYVGGGWHTAIYPPARDIPLHIISDEECIEGMERLLQEEMERRLEEKIRPH